MHLYEHDKKKTIHLNILAEILKLKINVPRFGKVGVYIRKMLHIPKKQKKTKTHTLVASAKNLDPCALTQSKSFEYYNRMERFCIFFLYALNGSAIGESQKIVLKN